MAGNKTKDSESETTKTFCPHRTESAASLRLGSPLSLRTGAPAAAAGGYSEHEGTGAPGQGEVGVGCQVREARPTST